MFARWDFPNTIIKKISDVVYKVKKEKGRKQVVVHLNDLKKCSSNSTVRNLDKKKEDKQPRASQHQTHPSNLGITEQPKVLPANLDNDDSEDEWFYEIRARPHRPTRVT